MISPALTSACVPGPNDVLFCQDEKRREHRGNVRFRECIEAEKDSFPVEPCVGQGLVIQRRKQKRIAKELVQRWRCQSPPGRFLYQSKDNKSVNWFDIGNERAIEVVLIALKEAAVEKRLAMSAQDVPNIPIQQINAGYNSAHANAAFLRSVAAATTTAATTTSNTDSTSRLITTSNDVLLGQGKTHRGHPGNLKYRMWIELHRVAFAKFNGEPWRQIKIAAGIVRKLREQKPVGGRFLYYLDSRTQWIDIGDDSAISITLNALCNGTASDNEMHEHPITSTGMNETIAATTNNPQLILEKGRISEVICLDEESDVGPVSTEEEGLFGQEEKSNGSIISPSRIECLEIIFPGDDSVTKLELPETTKDGPFSSLSDIVLLSPSAVHVQRLSIKRKHEDINE